MFKNFANFAFKQLLKQKNKFKFKSIYFIPFLLTPKILLLSEEKKNELEMKTIIRGEYENRIRAFATIEKKYGIFAGVKNFDEVRMNYYQFFDSLIPFCYSENTIPNQEV